MEGEMSQHERASFWVDNLPPAAESSDATGSAAGPATRDPRQSTASTTGDARSTIVRLRDNAQETRSVYYDTR